MFLQMENSNRQKLLRWHYFYFIYGSFHFHIYIPYTRTRIYFTPPGISLIFLMFYHHHNSIHKIWYMVPTALLLLFRKYVCVFPNIPYNKARGEMLLCYLLDHHHTNIKCYSVPHHLKEHEESKDKWCCHATRLNGNHSDVFRGLGILTNLLTVLIIH